MRANYFSRTEDNVLNISVDCDDVIAYNIEKCPIAFVT